MSIPGVSTDIGDAESVPVVIGAGETFTVRANTQVGYLNPPILEQGAQQVIEPGAIFYPAGQQSGPGGDALTTDPLSQFAATTSAQLAGVISDETGSGALVFATSPTLVTPILGTPASGNLANCTGYAYGSLTGVPATFTPASHTHGNITNAGAIGSTANLPLITGASGVLQVGSFGTTANTFAEGNDSRIVNAVNRTGDTLTGCLRTTEQTSTPTGTTATLTLDSGNHQTLSLASATGTVAVTLTVPSSSAAGTVILLQGTTVRNVTWTTSSGTIVWMGGEPDWDADAVSTSRVIAWRWNGSVMRLAATEVSS